LAVESERLAGHYSKAVWFQELDRRMKDAEDYAVELRRISEDAMLQELKWHKEQAKIEALTTK
jgi:hypothetical protein